MKRLVLGAPLFGPDAFKNWVEGALRDIEQSSAEDIEAVISEFTVTGDFTETRSLDASSATLADLRNFIATMVSDIQKGGQKRSYGS